MEPSLRYIKLAIKVAKNSTSKFRLGAVLTKKKQVISIGYNAMRKTHPIQQQICNNDFLRGIHAEVHACVGVEENDLNKAVLYVVRIKKDDKLCMSKPCNDCQRFLYNVGVSKVHYTTDFETINTIAFK